MVGLFRDFDVAVIQNLSNSYYLVYNFFKAYAMDIPSTHLLRM